ncbi:MAG: SDR family NAD(P)-dependent oxidoreductase, partial [Caldilineaceae bacterium]|nr:SDR family NAD(P)-dependent oxidoreductase [Caldilineaceae bacterium]
KQLPPTLNAQRPNPAIDFAATPFFLNHELREWPQPADAPRRAGVSAYGFGGTNFHLVIEEHVPGLADRERTRVAGVEIPKPSTSPATPATAQPSSPKPPLRGILALGATTPGDLAGQITGRLRRAAAGETPPCAAPDPAALAAPERLIVDFGDAAELADRLGKAAKAHELDNPQAWNALQAQGIFRGSGPRPGKIAFLFPGQGSQYANMGRDLAAREPAVAQLFAEADRVMTPILGKPLTHYIFVDGDDPAALKQAERDLMQTAITQPAMLTMDMALARLLGEYSFTPDMVMGHSLGEYGALIAAGIMPFADALEAAAARGAEMTRVSMDDNGWMAAVFAPLDAVQATLEQVDGYVVAANINSYGQAVIGGASRAVEEAIARFTQQGFRAQRIPVSHAFHTQIVAPASAPLRQVLDRLHITPPRLPLVANVTGDFYPTTVDGIKGILEQQIASPVQWVQGLETLYNAGVRAFVEVGPKKALKGFVDDVLGSRPGVWSLFTNHPKVGETQSFNHALCGLYAAGYGAPAVETHPAGTPIAETPIAVQTAPAATAPVLSIAKEPEMTTALLTPAAEPLGQALAQALQQWMAQSTAAPAAYDRAFNRNDTPLGSIVISGTGLGLPGASKPVMDPDNALRILRGEQFVDLIPARFRQAMVDKRITRLVKGDDGSGHFEVIADTGEVVKLAGRAGSFDLSAEYGVPQKLVDALDITTQFAMAAGLDALREAGIPLVQTFRLTSKGTYLPDRKLLPEPLRDETGVIFASAFPGGDRFAEELGRYFTWQNRLHELELLEDLRGYSADPATLAELARRAADLRETLEAEPYEFDRRFVFRILAMGHSQFAEYIGARGPNTHVNAACAATAQAIALAEDWIRDGRCRRVVVIAADNVTSDHLMEWIGAGFLAVGAVATDDRVEDAALPFDRRRHGTLLGMGACALVVESEDAVAERGMRGIVELLSSETANSAYHGTRLDVEHISQVMERLVTAAERRFGLHRTSMAAQTVFMSHETFTPARGGSAAAEVVALRNTFGDAAGEVIVSNTKGFTGHPMGVGVEDVIAVKILEYGIVPPVPNFREVDPELGVLNLSRGGRYPVQYALHLAAGFGSQIAMTLLRRIPGGLDRADQPLRYRRWLADVSGYDRPVTEVVQRVLYIQAAGAPDRPPQPSGWQHGTGPRLRAAAPGRDAAGARPQPMAAVRQALQPPGGNGGSPAPVAPVFPTTPPAPSEPLAVPPSPAAVERTPEAPQTGPNNGALPVVETPPTPVAAPPAVQPAAGQSIDPVAAQVLALVAQKTGYPSDMLDLDLDLEADLGIDTVKQAETFAAIRESFAIPLQEELNLRDYPTLAAVIGFVHTMRPDLGAAPAAPPVPSPAPEPVSLPSAPPAGEAAAQDAVTACVLAIVAEKTGYPAEMLALDLDLEADLGIDTVKQAETFATIREAYDIPLQQGLNLRDYPTLAAVIQFVRDMRPDLDTPPTPPPAPTPVAAPVPESAPAAETADLVADRVLAIVAEKTGYPAEMLELDLDLEADLGIDTVKQAETFATIRQNFDIPFQEGLNLRDYPTLAAVIGFVHTMRPDLAATSPVEAVVTPAAPAEPAKEAAPVVPGPVVEVADVSAADALPRRVPLPALRPSLDLCKPTGVTLDASSRVLVMLDQGGVGKALVNRLEKRGVSVLALEPPPSAAELETQLQAWLAEGPIQGVYWLSALDVEPTPEAMDAATWHDLNRVRIKYFYTTMRALYGSVRGAGRFLIAATRLGGMHGYGDAGAGAPLGGAVSGFAKAYDMEQRLAGAPCLVKVVDFEPGRKTAEPADLLLAETLADPGVVEVGYANGLRFTVTLVEQPAQPDPSIHLGPETVFLVTGAAGGITSAIVADLAAASHGIFYLLDLTPAPDAHDAEIGLLRRDPEALKQRLIDAARAAGERPTPAMINRKLAEVERRSAALAAVEAVQAAGGTAYYTSLDLRDGGAVAAVVDTIRSRHGRLDVLIHAAGLLVDRALPGKEPGQFDLVFDVKADGFYHLLHAAQGLPIGATVAFSSVAGRFGNNGQTDYSAANDLLCKITGSLRAWRPATRGLVIDWTAWAEIGMAARGSVPQIMDALGVDMLPPAVGIPTLRRELLAGSRGEVLVAGRLGAWLDELDPTGGLDLDKARAVQSQAAQPSFMAAALTSAGRYSGLHVETPLDPKTQPFLHDHAPDPGVPWLPGVMAVEALAETAALAAPGYRVAAVEDVRMLGAFKFFRMEPRTLYLQAQALAGPAGELTAQTVLRSQTPPAREGLPARIAEHFQARVRLVTDAPGAPQVDFTPPSDLPISAERIYARFFHGPAYQVLEAGCVEADRAVARLRRPLPADTQPAGAVWRMAPRLVEACFQTVALWSLEQKGAMALPAGIGRVSVYRQLDDAGDAPLYAVVQPAPGGTTFAAQVVDTAGNVYVELEGFRTVARPE